MARYFFHLRDGDTLLPDDEGIELRDLEDARSYAIESARQLLSEAALSGTAGSGCVSEKVSHGSGGVVLLRATAIGGQWLA